NRRDAGILIEHDLAEDALVLRELLIPVARILFVDDPVSRHEFLQLVSAGSDRLRLDVELLVGILRVHGGAAKRGVDAGANRPSILELDPDGLLINDYRPLDR